MHTISEILNQAKARAQGLGFPYAGSLTPAEAGTLLKLAPGAKIVDVRTRAEWDWVGRIPGAVEIEWISYPGNQQNTDFLAHLKRQVDPESLVMFICRSGARSHKATCLANEAGYAECYNVLEGFEGDLDANGQRGNVNGWRHAGQVWKS